MSEKKARQSQVSPPMNRVMTAVILAVLTASLPVFLFGSLAIQMKEDMHLSTSRIGIATSLYFGASTLTSVLAGGLVARRLSSTAGLRLATTLGALSLLGMSATQNFAQLGVSLVLGGLSYALTHPSANQLVAYHIDASRLGTAMAAKQSSVMGAVLLGGAAVPAFGVTIGWRWAFLCFLLFPIGALILTPTQNSEAEDLTLQRKKPDISLRPVMIMALAGGLAAGASGNLGAFLVASSVDEGISVSTAGILQMAGSLSSIIARLYIGVRSDRSEKNPMRTLSTLMGTGAIGYLLLSLSGNSLGIVTIGTILAYGAGWGWAGLFHATVVQKNMSAPGWATGITQTGVYAGAVIGPLGFGLLAETLSYSAAWASAATLVLSAAFCIEFSRRLFDREAEIPRNIRQETNRTAQAGDAAGL